MQVRLLPVSNEVLSYVRVVEQELRSAGLRVEVDDSSETLPKKIRNAETQKIPVMAIVGTKEASAQTVSLRFHGGKDGGARSLTAATSFLAEHVQKKSLHLP